jgi:FKBP-type peptidyl-prolyl cis-trans isomerase FkpA
MKKVIVFVLLTGAFMLNAAAQGLIKTPRGASYQIIKAGGGQKIQMNDVITFDFIQQTDKDSVLASSYQRGTPAKTQVDSSKNVGDIKDIFLKLSVGDSAIVKVQTDSMFVGHEDQRPPFFPKGSSIVFLLKILRIQTLDEAIAEKNAAEDKLRAARTANALKLKASEAAMTGKFIADNKLAFKTTPTGLKYTVTQASAKRKPLKGDTLLVNYVGRMLSGKVFDTSIADVAKSVGLEQPGRTYEPIEVVVGTGRVIPGWDEGLLLLNEGSKATFLIPSKLAYGERGAGQDIAPYSPLLFDVELVKIKPAPHKPAVAKAGAAKPAAKKAPVRKAVVKKKVTTK